MTKVQAVQRRKAPWWARLIFQIVAMILFVSVFAFWMARMPHASPLAITGLTLLTEFVLLAAVAAAIAAAAFAVVSYQLGQVRRGTRQPTDVIFWRV